MKTDTMLERIELELTLRTQSLLHIGVDKSLHEVHPHEQTALACIKTATHIPFIPGATCRGLLRSRVLDRLVTDQGNNELQALHSLLGHQNEASAIHVMDALATHYSTSPVSRTAIDAITGTAAQRQLFSKEVINPGSRFTVRIRVRDPAGNPLNTSLLHPIAQLLGVFADEPLGADKSIGYGQLSIEGSPICRVITIADYRKWLAADPTLPLTSCLQERSLSELTLQPRYTDIVFRIKQLEPLLINDPARVSERTPADNNTTRKTPAVDLIAAQRQQQCLLPGSTIKGAFKASVQRILQATQQSAASTITALLFGSTKSGFGALRFNDGIGVGTTTETRTMIKSDRHTALPVPFVAEALWTDHIQTRIEIDLQRLHGENCNYYVALLLYALRDWFEEDIRLGWGTTRGFGLVYGFTGDHDPYNQHTADPWRATATQFIQTLYPDQPAPSPEQIFSSEYQPDNPSQQPQSKESAQPSNHNPVQPANSNRVSIL